MNNLIDMFWRPIESAPKGKPILLWWRTCKYPAIGQWTVKKLREGWMCDGDQCLPKNQEDCTHWMPLPYPPEPLSR